jgi:hypothetical protein
MEIEWIVFVIDVLGSAVIGLSLSKKINKQIELAGALGGILPLIVLMFQMVRDIPHIPDMLLPGIATFLVGWVVGAVSTALFALLAAPLKKLFSYLRSRKKYQPERSTYKIEPENNYRRFRKS